MLISIVIPFHNEELSLPQLLSELTSVIGAVDGHQFEVWLVDDSSTDQSAKIAQSFCLENSAFNLLQLPTRSGQTGAFQAAFSRVNGHYTVRMDADLQDDPADLEKFLLKMTEGYDVILGLRQNRQHSLGLKVLTRAYDLLTSRLFNADLQSNSGSFIAFRTPLIRNIPFKPNDHRYLPLICIRRGASKRIGVPIRHRARQHGQSKYKLSKKMLLGIFEVYRFYRRYSKGHYDFESKNPFLVEQSEAYRIHLEGHRPPRPLTIRDLDQ